MVLRALRASARFLGECSSFWVFFALAGFSLITLITLSATFVRKLAVCVFPPCITARYLLTYSAR